MSLANNAKSIGGEGFGTIAPEPTVQSVSKRKYDHLGNTQSGSNDSDGLESPAKVGISSESERCNSTANSAIQHTLCELGRRESAVLYITPLQKDLWAHSVELSSEQACLGFAGATPAPQNTSLYKNAANLGVQKEQGL